MYCSSVRYFQDKVNYGLVFIILIFKIWECNYLPTPQFFYFNFIFIFISIFISSSLKKEVNEKRTTAFKHNILFINNLSSEQAHT